MLLVVPFPRCQEHRGAPPHGLRGATPSQNMNVCKYEQGEEMELRHTTRWHGNTKPLNNAYNLANVEIRVVSWRLRWMSCRFFCPGSCRFGGWSSRERAGH